MVFLLGIFLICSIVHPMNADDVYLSIIQKDEKSFLEKIHYQSRYLIGGVIPQLIEAHKEDDLVWILRVLKNAGCTDLINEITLFFGHSGGPDFDACRNFFLEVNTKELKLNGKRKRETSLKLPGDLVKRYKMPHKRLFSEIKQGNFESFKNILENDPTRFYLPTLIACLKYANHCLNENVTNDERSKIVHFIEAKVRLKRISRFSQYKKVISFLKEGNNQALEEFFSKKILYNELDAQILKVVDILSNFEPRWRSFNPVFRIYYEFIVQHEPLQWYEKNFLKTICSGDLPDVINDLIMYNFPAHITHDEILDFIASLFQATKDVNYACLSLFLENKTHELLLKLKKSVSSSLLYNFFKALLSNNQPRCQVLLKTLFPLSEELLSTFRTIIEQIAFIENLDCSLICSTLSPINISAEPFEGNDNFILLKLLSDVEYNKFIAAIEHDDLKYISDILDGDLYENLIYPFKTLDEPLLKINQRIIDTADFDIEGLNTRVLIRDKIVTIAELQKIFPQDSSYNLAYTLLVTPP